MAQAAKDLSKHLLRNNLPYHLSSRDRYADRNHEDESQDLGMVRRNRPLGITRLNSRVIVIGTVSDGII